IAEPATYNRIRCFNFSDSSFEITAQEHGTRAPIDGLRMRLVGRHRLRGSIATSCRRAVFDKARHVGITLPAFVQNTPAGGILTNESDGAPRLGLVSMNI